MRHAIRNSITALFFIIASGCAQQQSADFYVRPSSAIVEQAYVKPDADFSRYSKLMFEGLGIFYPDDVPEPPQADLDRIREIFRREFADAVSDKYEIVNTPGPDVLNVEAQIIDMKIIGDEGTYDPGGRLRDLVTRGELTFLMEVSDSVSGEVLGTAGDRTTDISAGGESAKWAEVEAAAVYWAGLFRGWLDRSLGHN